MPIQCIFYYIFNLKKPQKKSCLSAALFDYLNYYLQLAGRYLAGIEPAHTHCRTAWLVPVVKSDSCAAVPVASTCGVRVIVWSLTSLLIFWAVTVITPAVLVATDFTYFDTAEALSQPNAVVPVGVEANPVCDASTIAVLQVSAARITSETLARTV